MTGVRNDPRVRRTRAAIRDAFVQLMLKKEYDAITVTDISEAAQVNRKTFYTHFETKERLFMQVLGEMFFDLFSTFMYEKPAPGAALALDTFSADVEDFFVKVEGYRLELGVLITAQTAELAFAIADEVIRRGLEKIHVLSDPDAGVVPVSLYVSRIKNFFLTSIDWWLEQPNPSPAEAARIYCKMMRLSAVNIFRYQQMQRVSDK